MFQRINKRSKEAILSMKDNTILIISSIIGIGFCVFFTWLLSLVIGAWWIVIPIIVFIVVFLPTIKPIFWPSENKESKRVVKDRYDNPVLPKKDISKEDT